MKILTIGHRYELQNFEHPELPGQTIQFIEKTLIPNTNGNLKTVNDGTSNEEVISVLLNRLNSMYEKFPSRETAIAITKLDEALLWLQKRTQDRINRKVEGKYLP